MPRPYASGTAQIQETGTGIVHTIEGGSLEWDSQGTGERQMGDEVEHRGTIDHEVLGELTWVLFEYPMGVENMRDHELNGHTLVSDLDWGLRHSPDE
jgi:hypothetical protein